MNKIPGAIIIEGHIQGLSNVRALGEKGIPVIVVDKTNCIARYSKYCLAFKLCSDFSSDDFADFLINLAITENLKEWVLFPSNDHAVHTISRFKSKLEEYFKVITPHIETIGTIYDKARLIELAEKIKVPAPLTIRNSNRENMDDFNGFPALIKGRYGLSFYKKFGKKAFFIENRDELEKQLGKISTIIELSDTITQELIPSNGNNRTISFTAFASDGKILSYWVGEKIREHPIHFGTATFCKSVEINSLLEPSEALMGELQYTGVCEIEYLKDPRDNRYKLIEINPRTWLWVGLAKACGVDYAGMVYNYFHGETVFPNHKELLSEVYWSNYLTDFFYSTKAVINRTLNIREFKESYRGNVIRAIYSRSDVKPGIVYLLLLFKYLRTR